MKKQATTLMLTALVAGTALSAPSFAQDKSAEGDKVMSVYQRYRPDYDAPGIRSGSFLFKPTMGVSGKFDSNIFARDGRVLDPIDDYVVLLKPSFDLVSDWNTDFFRLYGNAEISQYMDNGTEEYEDFTIGASGRKDISQGMSLTADVFYREGHEDRGAPNAIGNQIRPTTLSVLGAKVGFKRDVAILSLAVNGSYEKHTFDNIALQGGGTANNARRDHDILKLTNRIGYELSDGYEAFLRGSLDRIEYDNSKADAVLGNGTPVLNNGPQRNSDGLEVVGGAAFDLTGKAKGEVYLGYIRREYDSDTLGVVDGLNYGATLLWNPTGLTSVTLGVKRSIEETILAGDDGVSVDPDGEPIQVPSAGLFNSNFSLSVEHELRRNILLKADASFSRINFVNILREDDVYNAGIGAKYLINRNLNAGLNYTISHRDTNASGGTPRPGGTLGRQNFLRHAIMLNVTAQW